MLFVYLLYYHMINYYFYLFGQDWLHRAECCLKLKTGNVELHEIFQSYSCEYVLQCICIIIHSDGLKILLI